MEHVKGLDHLVFLARDLEASIVQLRRLGFKVSARGEHDRLQTANHTVIFQRDYIELFTVRTRCPENESFYRQLQRREGLGYLVFATDNADKLCAELKKAGVNTTGPTDFSRAVTRPEGKCEASFRIVRVSPDDAAGATFFYCQHNTPELVWLPELSIHENRVFGIYSVTLVAESIEKQVKALSRNIGELPARDTEFGVVLQLGTHQLVVQTSALYAQQHGLLEEEVSTLVPFYGAVVLATDDITETRKVLEKNLIPFFEHDASITVDRRDSLGIFLTFCEFGANMNSSK